MTENFVAEKQVTVKASADTVWKALTDPALVQQYMYGMNLETSWEVGSPIRWKGEWHGEPYEDKGTVLAVEPKKLLSVTHWSPMGGSEDKPENYHTLTYELDERGNDTVLTLKQDNNPSQEAANVMADQSWGPVLEGLRAVAEQQKG
jgi:uncharacterized protein YndB with AHSA1/START domain